MNHIEGRDESFRKMCDEIAWKEGFVVRAKDHVAYLDTAEQTFVLCRPERHNKFWYETWMALRYNRPPGAPQPINKTF